MAKRGRKPELTKQLTDMLDSLSRYLLHLERRVETLEARTARHRRRRRRRVRAPRKLASGEATSRDAGKLKEPPKKRSA